MIHFQLKCSQDHEFKAWFRSSESFADQCKRGDVGCPICGDVQISKALMTPSIAKGKIASGYAAEKRAQEVAEQVLNAAKKLREVVEENFEYVGDDFADEARAIHYGDTIERDIYGEATEKEAEELDEEGIDFTRIPKLTRSTRRKG
jgi:hypothetical protein